MVSPIKHFLTYLHLAFTSNLIFLSVSQAADVDSRLFIHYANVRKQETVTPRHVNVSLSAKSPIALFVLTEKFQDAQGAAFLQRVSLINVHWDGRRKSLVADDRRRRAPIVVPQFVTGYDGVSFNLDITTFEDGLIAAGAKGEVKCELAVPLLKLNSKSTRFYEVGAATTEPFIIILRDGKIAGCKACVGGEPLRPKKSVPYQTQEWYKFFSQ